MALTTFGSGDVYYLIIISPLNKVKLLKLCQILLLQSNGLNIHTVKVKGEQYIAFLIQDNIKKQAERAFWG